MLNRQRRGQAADPAGGLGRPARDSAPRFYIDPETCTGGSRLYPPVGLPLVDHPGESRSVCARIPCPTLTTAVSVAAVLRHQCALRRALPLVLPRGA